MSLEKERTKEKLEDLERRLVKSLRFRKLWLMMNTGTLIDMNVGLIALVVMRKAESERFEAEMDSSLQLLVPIALVEGRSFFS
jgi:hypothetical protein